MRENKNNIDLAKSKIGARIFFSRTSQGHNAVPRPGLEPGSSDSEPSALTTHVKCSTFRTSKFFRLDGLLLICIIMGLRSASSANILKI